MVSGPGSGGWRRRRWRSMCASASYWVARWRHASLSSSAPTAALTCGGNPGGGCLNEHWGYGHCRRCPPPFPPLPSWCPVACLAPEAPACHFSRLPVRPCPPVRTLLSGLCAAPATGCPRLRLPSSFLHSSRGMDFMAAAGTLSAAGCPGPPPTAILLASSPSSSDTRRTSSTTDPPCPTSLPAINSARLNRSASRLTTACCPCSSPCPQLPLLRPPSSLHLPLLALPCLLPPLSLPRPHLSSAAPPFAALPAGPSLDSPETRVATPPRTSPRTSVNGAVGLSPPTCGPHGPSLPPAPAPRTPSMPAAAARPPLLATGLTSAQACGTSFGTHGIVSEPWALPSLPPASRALHLAAPSVPLFARPTCAVLLTLCSWLSLLHASAYCGLFQGSRWPRAEPSLPCPRTPCYVPLFGVLLLPLYTMCALLHCTNTITRDKQCACCI